MSVAATADNKEKEEALAGFRRALLEHNEMNARLKERKFLFLFCSFVCDNEDFFSR